MGLNGLFKRKGERENRAYYLSYLTELASTTYNLSKEREEYKKFVQAKKENSNNESISERIKDLSKKFASTSSKIESLSYNLDCLEKNGEKAKYRPVVEEYVASNPKIEYVDDFQSSSKSREFVRTRNL